MFSFVSLLLLQVRFTEPRGIERTVCFFFVFFFVLFFIRKEGSVSGEARLGEVYPF